MKRNKDDNQVIYTYRYIWLQKHRIEKPDRIDYETKTCIKLLSGVIQEHNIFIDSLKSNENILSAAREYMGHYDLRFLNDDDNRLIKGGKDK